MFYDQLAGSGYESFPAEEIGGANEILVLIDDAKLTTFGEVSPLSRALGKQLMFRRLHVAPQWRDNAVEVVRSLTA
jgi:hypothetical protein